MREIKFRQFDLAKKRYQFNIGVTGPGSWSGPSYCTWESYPLEQFTGLHDKNGREIYEGDIVQSESPVGRAGVIQFAKGHFGVNWDFVKNPDPEWEGGIIYGSWGTQTNLRRIDDGFLDEFVVIGNIHENPELLK